METFMVSTYNVGQGLFNLVLRERMDGTCYCGVFDCGTLSTTKNKVNMDEFNKAAAMIQECEGIDAIIISHQDADHWSLLEELLQNVYGVNLKNTGRQWYYNESKNMLMKSDNKRVSTIRRSRLFENAYTYSTITEYEVATRKTIIEKQYYCNPPNFETYYIKLHIEEFTVTLRKNKTTTFFWFFGRNKGTICKYYPSDAFEDGMDDFCTEVKALCEEEDIGNDIKNAFMAAFEGIPDLDRVQMICQEVIPMDISIKNVLVGGAGREFGYRLFCKRMSWLGENIIDISSAEVCFVNDDMTKMELQYFPLNTNLPSAFEPEIIRNSSSVVAIYQPINGLYVIFPGDSTVHAFDGLVTAIPEEIRGNVPVMIAPHHGSLHTNYIFGEDGNLLPSDEQPFYRLLEKICPHQVYISAAHEPFNHPNCQFVFDTVSVCDAYREHEIGFGTDGNYEIEEITKAVFTTECSGKLEYSTPFDNSCENERKKQQYVLPNDHDFLPRGEDLK